MYLAYLSVCCAVVLLWSLCCSLCQFAVLSPCCPKGDFLFLVIPNPSPWGHLFILTYAYMSEVIYLFLSLVDSTQSQPRDLDGVKQVIISHIIPV